MTMRRRGAGCFAPLVVCCQFRGAFFSGKVEVCQTV